MIPTDTPTPTGIPTPVSIPTTVPTIPPGTVWVEPEQQTVELDEEFSVEICVVPNVWDQ